MSGVWREASVGDALKGQSKLQNLPTRFCGRIEYYYYDENYGDGYATREKVVTVMDCVLPAEIPKTGISGVDGCGGTITLLANNGGYYIGVSAYDDHYTDYGHYYIELIFTKVEQLIEVQAVKIDESKTGQEELNFSCNAAAATVNLNTGRLLLNSFDISMGANAFVCGVAHIYNSQFKNLLPDNITTSVGDGFKLDCQQYIYLKDGKRFYMDAQGYSHEFDLTQYGMSFDKTGLGLKYDNNKTISDTLGNKMMFNDSGALTSIISANGNTKNFVYTGGKLTEIFNTAVSERRLKLNYNAQGLLDKIDSMAGNAVIESAGYTYTDGRLILIKRMRGQQAQKNVLKFFYNAHGNMSGVCDCESEKGLEFSYYDHNITQVADGKYSGSATMSEKYNETGIAYCDGYTTVYRESGVNLRYYFDYLGYNSGVFEEKNGALFTLTKRGGTGLLKNADGAGVINGCPAISINSERELTNEVKDYFFEEKNALTKIFYISFFANITAGGILAVGITTESSEEVFESKVVNAEGWQFVVVPVINRADTPDKIKSVRLTCDKPATIAEVRIDGTPAPCMEIAFNGNKRYLFEFDTIMYTADGTTITKELTADFYMDEADIIKTCQSMYRARGVYDNENDYELICNSGTKTITRVSEVILLHKGKNFPLNIGSAGIAMPNYSIVTKMPGVTVTAKTEYRVNETLIAGYTVPECIKQISEIVSDTATGAEYQWSTFDGRELKKQDEYGAVSLCRYDALGNLTKSEVLPAGYNPDYIGTETPDIKDKVVTEYVYDARGENLLAIKTPFSQSDNQAEYEYTADGVLNKIKKINANTSVGVTEFGYDTYKEKLTSAMFTGSNSIGMKNKMWYDAGRLSALSQVENPRYTVGYNIGNGVSSMTISSNGTPLTTSSYNKYLRKETVNRGGGDIETVFDKYGRTVSQKFGESESLIVYQQVAESSDATGQALSVFDPYEGRYYEYEYDDNNNLTGCAQKEGTYIAASVKKTDANTVKYYRNGNDYVSVKEEKNDKSFSPRITAVETALNSIQGSKNLRTEYVYDAFGRIKENKIRHVGYLNAMDEERVYKSVSGSALPLIEKQLFRNNDAGIFLLEADYIYNREKLTGCTERLANTVLNNSVEKEFSRAYSYDAYSRLTREDNNEMYIDSAREYIYNNEGDISEVRNASGAITKSFGYTEGRLTSVNGSGITYNGSGFPLNYMGKAMSWTRGALLASCGNVQYRYNAGGVRFEKTAEGVTRKYYLDGSKILGEHYTGGSMTYIYDAEGLAGVTRQITQSNGTSAEEIYIYQKDAQRNIIGISRGGQIVARYAYNAYGECRITAYNTQLQEVTEAQTPNHIAYLNPFRYKSYYYDRETGLYYLNSRYYDPATCRFISPDDVSYLDPMSINGLDLYAVLGNNPIAFAPNRANICNNGLSGAGSGYFAGTGSYSSVNGARNIVNRTEQVNTIGLGVFAQVIGGAQVASQLIGQGFGQLSSAFTMQAAGLADDLIFMGGGVFARVSNKLGEAYTGLANANAARREFFGAASKVAKVVGVGLYLLDVGLSAYNNFTNTNLTATQQWGYFGTDFAASTTAFALGWFGGPIGGLIGLGAWVAYEFWLKDIIQGWF